MLAARLLSSPACRAAARLQPFQWYHTDNSTSTSESSTTDFGFQQVDAAAKAGLVAQVFSNVAPSYDIMNDLMSAGLHRLWKNHLVQVLRPFAGMQHLDVAGGTGDVAFRVLQAIQQAEALAQRQQQTAHGRPGPVTQPAQPEMGTVTVCDINPGMLKEGMKRAEAMGVADGRLCWVEGDAERLPFEDDSFDAYTVTFGIRNVTNRDAALREALRVLRRGGRFLCMEFSQVEEPLLRQAYDSYSFAMIPLMGQLVAGDRASYQYLVESIRMFPTQEQFQAMIEEAGFKEVKYENLLGGVVALHSGFKL